MTTQRCFRVRNQAMESFSYYSFIHPSLLGSHMFTTVSNNMFCVFGNNGILYRPIHPNLSSLNRNITDPYRLESHCKTTPNFQNTDVQQCFMNYPVSIANMNNLCTVFVQINTEQLLINNYMKMLFILRLQKHFSF